LNRIRHTIRDRYHEPTLDAGAVAAANGISKRYLHYLFAQASSTFGNELMQVAWTAHGDCSPISATWDYA
jgi:hypothetical protein